jgi:N-acetylmuramoyl-L-alanine amidase
MKAIKAMKIRVQSYKITQTQREKMSAINTLCAIIIVFVCFLSTNTQAQKDELSLQTIRTVCIDAGHGGKDPGCHGASANEKTVCLNIALKLGKKIQETFPGIKVVYTRDKDVFVELDERAKIANKSKADLFICIHANSASPGAYGAETYVLGLHRTESQQKIAERENSTIYLEADGGQKYKDFDLSPDALIARQLQLAIYLDQSISFASKLQGEFKKLGRFDRGVKQAGFLVLYKTTMPSVLIESGFLTNPDEEKFLADTASQTKMAEAMFVAFQKYKNELEGVDEMKGVKPTVPFNPQQGTTAPTGNEVSENVYFRVQIETSDSKVSLTSSRFKGVEVQEYQQDKLYKYTSGNFENDFEAANKYKNTMREKGFQHAFVVAFLNGERIPLDKAMKLAKKEIAGG